MHSNRPWLAFLSLMTSGCFLDFRGLADGSVGCQSLSGPALVFVATPAPGFCIDATEVTRRDYQAFLEAKADSTAGQGSSCEWNTSFTPKVWSITEAELELPVVQVDWCDAVAYCTWAGKHLCGAISGGTLAPTEVNDPTTDEWYAACSDDDQLSYPYGNAFQAKACASDRDSAATVKSVAGCEGGTAGVFDMSGNVREWIDACDDTITTGTAAARDGCWLRGGAYVDSEQTLLACRAPQDSTEFRDTKSDSVGFRCCGP